MIVKLEEPESIDNDDVEVVECGDGDRMRRNVRDIEMMNLNVALDQTDVKVEQTTEDLVIYWFIIYSLIMYGKYSSNS